MSKSYYYFAASLPMLNFDSRAVLSGEEFLRHCKQLLDGDDFTTIKGILSGDFSHLSSKNPTAKSIAKYYGDFANLIASFRANRAGKDPLDYIRGEAVVDPKLSEVIAQAAKQSNLYEAEKILDLARWQYLEEVVVGHYFDLDFIIVYGLKLKILERYENLRSTKGSEIFEQIKDMDISDVEIKELEAAHS